MLALIISMALAGAECPQPAPNTLLLDEQAFDQNGDKGWRPLARPGCFIAAADLIAQWRAKHPGHGNMLFFHEAQMRAAGGDLAAAAPLFRRSASGTNEWRIDTGWNDYVAASEAFALRDLTRLQVARDRLAALPVPAEQKGVAEAARREPRPEVWPPNLDVVDSLLRCFDKPYGEALQPPCRRQSPTR